MARYSISGAAGAASATAATAGIVKVDNAATVLSTPQIYEFSVCPGAAAEDSNYTIQAKRQTTAGTWTSVTPSPLDPSAAAAKAAGGRASTAAGTAGVILGIWGFNQRGGFRWVAVPGGELVVDRANSNGIIIEYAVVQGTAVNYGCIMFEE
jgi:hypothetical protein